MVVGIFRRPKVTTEPEMVKVLERPKEYKPQTVYKDGELDEYIQLANETGVYIGDVWVERLKAFLVKNDISVFNLQEVCTYMDAKAKMDASNNGGWRWLPYRGKDRIGRGFGSWNSRSSDWYHANHPIYDKLIPKQALKKVALISKEFGEQVNFFVTDYTPKPGLLADPFLMVVVPLSSERLSTGEGRFVIDFWDEPGFGLEQQLR
jgi:hypothetical protein